MKYSLQILICTLLIFPAGSNAAAPRNGLPIALWEAAELNNCEDLDGFYEKTDTYDPPFVFGLFEDGINSEALAIPIRLRLGMMIVWYN